MTDFSPQQVMEAVAALQSAVEVKSAESKGTALKIEAYLDEQESKSAEFRTKLNVAEQKNLELEAKLAALETVMSRPNLATDEKAAVKAEIKAVSNFCLKGLESLSLEEKAFFRTDSDTGGGYLVQGAFDTAITRNIVEFSPIRSLATVQTLTTNRLSVPREDGTVTVSWVGEAGTVTSQATTFKRDNINVNKVQACLVYTTEALEDTFTDLEGYGARLVAEQMAKAEGLAFISGDANLKPEGFIDTVLMTPRNSGVAAELTFDAILQLQGDLKVGYNAQYLFNRSTRVAIQLMKSGVNYLWQAGNVAAGVPNTINGESYTICQDMADIAANSVPIAYADLRKGYKIVDRTGVSILRDELTLKKEGKVEFLFTKRVGGGIVQPEAIKLLKCAV